MTVLHTEGIGMTSRRTRERMIRRLVDQGIQNKDILDAMRNVPRHLFVDDALASRSYEDTALPIGHGQTISQPYIVAKMTELLVAEKAPLKKVLEIGTGCGYQAAVLAQIVGHVYSVERIQPLYQQAKDLLSNLQINNISFLYSDGAWGWQEKGLFDGILVAAAPPDIPESLLQQLAVGGTMLIPIGVSRTEQILKRVTRTASGYDIENLETVSFVPFLAGVN